MKRVFVLLAMLLVVAFTYGEEKPDTAKVLKEGVYVVKSGYTYSHYGDTFTEIYEVVTDSVVHRFGLVFNSSDSSFVKKVRMEDCNRKVYDMMNETTARVIANQEKYRKETLEFVNRFRASSDVWLLFKLYNILRK